MKILLKVFLALVLLYFVVGGGLFCVQKHFLFFPTKAVQDMPSHLPLEEVSFLNDNGDRLSGWFLDNGSDRTVLFFHGNAGNLSHRVAQMEIFHNLGLNALIFDYRGYGKSEGTIRKETDSYADSQAALRFLTQTKSIPQEHIIVWGRSLGGALAIDLLAKESFEQAVVESTFTSIDDMTQGMFPIFPVRLLLRFHFNSLAKVNMLTTETLFIHSEEDEVIPFTLGEALFTQAPQPKSFLRLTGSHNTGFLQNREVYLEQLKLFLDEN